MTEQIAKIKINKKDTNRGFYILLQNGPARCLKNDEFVVPKYCLNILKKEKVKFKPLVL